MTEITFGVKLFALVIFVTAGVLNSMALRSIRSSKHRSSLWFVRGVSLGDGLSWVGAILVLGWILWGFGGTDSTARDVLIVNTWILLPLLAVAVAMCAFGALSKSRRGERRR